MKSADPRAREKRAEMVQMVAFSVGEGEYALDIMRMKEIINPLPITPVPKAPSFIEGVIELRGAILPVVDMRKRFDLSPTAQTRSTKYMIVGIDVQGRRMIVGLIVDAVSEPIRLAKEQLRPAPALTVGANAYFTAVVHHQGRIFMVMDIDAILSTREKITLAGIE